MEFFTKYKDLFEVPPVSYTIIIGIIRTEFKAETGQRTIHRKTLYWHIFTGIQSQWKITLA